MFVWCSHGVLCNVTLTPERVVGVDLGDWKWCARIYWDIRGQRAVHCLTVVTTVVAVIGNSHQLVTMMRCKFRPLELS